MTLVQALSCILGPLLMLSRGLHGNTNTPVYGYQGASSTLVSGRPLHYKIDLTQCHLLAGMPMPVQEFVHLFGGSVTTWRTFNDRDISDIPFMEFHEQRLTHNSTGGLVQLTRGIRVWYNNTVDVTSAIYTPGFGICLSVYTHECSMASASKLGDIDLRAGSASSTRLISYGDLYTALVDGRYVRFSAMTFLCVGGREHTFSSFGGHLPNYEFSSTGQLHTTDVSVQTIVHMNQDMLVADVINMRFYANRTVDIIDTRTRPPMMEKLHEHVSNCILYTAMPGGTVSLFAE